MDKFWDRMRGDGKLTITREELQEVRARARQKMKDMNERHQEDHQVMLETRRMTKHLATTSHLGLNTTTSGASLSP